MQVIRLPRRSAFTLIELLVVIAIIAILIGLSCPPSRKSAKPPPACQCGNNLKQIGLATHACNGRLWRHARIWLRLAARKRDDNAVSNFWAILPFIEPQNLYSALPAGQASAAFNGAGTPATVKTYICPSDGSGITAGWEPGTPGICPATTSTARSSPGRILNSAPRSRDGTSTTVMYVEHLALCRGPNDSNSRHQRRGTFGRR